MVRIFVRIDVDMTRFLRDLGRGNDRLDLVARTCLRSDARRTHWDELTASKALRHRVKGGANGAPFFGRSPGPLTACSDQILLDTLPGEKNMHGPSKRHKAGSLQGSEPLID